jgi:dihydroorotase (multifunctional complex type)
MAEAGVTAFKTFMATSFGPLLISDKGTLYAAFEEVAETDLPLYIHAEDEEYLELFTSRAHTEHGDAMNAFFESRPPIAETTAVADVLNIVRETSTKTVFAHVTTAEALEQISGARRDGLPVHAEVTPYHLTFDREDIAKVGTHGIGTPPVRDAQNKAQLWSHLERGDVQLLGSDHAPHTLAEKERAPLDVAPGMPQLETALGALLDAVNRGRTSLSTVVELYSEAPSRLHGLFPNKGTLRPGTDADFVVINLDEEWVVDPSQFESKGHYSPFEGETLTGRPIATYQRGQRIAESMRVVGDPGYGEPLRPDDGERTR